MLSGEVKVNIRIRFLARWWLGTGTGSPWSGHSTKPYTAQEEFGQPSQARGDSWGCLVEAQELVSMILVGLFQLRIFYNSMIINYVSRFRSILFCSALLLRLYRFSLAHSGQHPARNSIVWFYGLFLPPYSVGFPLCHEMNSLSESPQCTNFASSHRLSSVATEKGESTQPKAGLEVVRKTKWDLGIHVWPYSLP